jgi:hypothetical protein
VASVHRGPMPWKAIELTGAQLVATPKLKGADQGGRRGRGTCSRPHLTVNGGEVTWRQCDAVVGGAHGGVALGVRGRGNGDGKQARWMKGSISVCFIDRWRRGEVGRGGGPMVMVGSFNGFDRFSIEGGKQRGWGGHRFEKRMAGGVVGLTSLGAKESAGVLCGTAASGFGRWWWRRRLPEEENEQHWVCLAGQTGGLHP